MKEMTEIKPEEFNENVFDLIGKEWMLISAEKEKQVNTMTASWGGFGQLWNQSVAFCFIRQTRFTKVFVDGSKFFSLSFLDHAKYSKQLAYLGTISGRDEDKIHKEGLHVVEGKAPYFEEAKIVIICQKLARVPIRGKDFIDQTIQEKWYDGDSYHDMYVGKIVKILVEKKPE
jgi:flavin reductase (DIM6/NTAB) family NADH-FMN oxidoreductase RutF